MGIFLLSDRWASSFIRPVGLLCPLGGNFFSGGFGRYWGGQNWKRIFEKTGVVFGRTELSLRAIGTTFCALSSGHGPRGLDFQRASSGWIHDFSRGGTSDKIGKVFLKKLVSDLVVQSYR